VGGLLIAAAAWCAGHRRHPRSLSSTRA
jgi:hypothetical protein